MITTQIFTIRATSEIQKGFEMHQPCETFKNKVTKIKDNITNIECYLIYMGARVNISDTELRYLTSAKKALENIRREFE